MTFARSSAVPWVVVVMMSLVPSSASAQAPTASSDGSPNFLALDIGAGVTSGPSAPKEVGEDDRPNPFGGWWWTDATVRFARPWFGLGGSFARMRSGEDLLTISVAQTRVSSSYRTSASVLGRVFAHAGIGDARLRPANGSAARSVAINAGAGFDAFFLRLAVDYLHVNLPGLAKHSAAAYFGAAVPLCFRGCRPKWEDGLDLSKWPKP